MAIVNHASQSGGAVISNETMTKVVPIFVSAMILLIRVLIIGTFSLAGDRLFTTQNHSAYNNNYSRPAQQQQIYRPAPSQQSSAGLRPASTLNRPVQTNMQAQGAYRPATPAPKPVMQQTTFTRPEPTYHPYSSGQNNNDRPFDA